MTERAIGLGALLGGVMLLAIRRYIQRRGREAVADDEGVWTGGNSTVGNNTAGPDVTTDDEPDPLAVPPFACGRVADQATSLFIESRTLHERTGGAAAGRRLVRSW